MLISRNATIKSMEKKMSLSKKASDLFRRSPRAKSDYTAKELAKTEAYLKEEGFILPSYCCNATLHRFIKEDKSASATLYLEGTGAFKGSIMIMNYFSEYEGKQTLYTTFRDYVKQKEIAATKNRVRKFLKRVI
jgi:hypothetical protein